MTAPGAERKAVAKADPAPAPCWYTFRGVLINAEAVRPRPSVKLS